MAINESHVRQRQLGLSGFHGPVPGIFGMFLPWSELEGMFGTLLVGHFWNFVLIALDNQVVGQMPRLQPIV